MSKIGKQPIVIPEGVTVAVEGTTVKVGGKHDLLTIPLLSGAEVKAADGVVTVGLAGKGKQSRANWGTLRALIANAIEGQAKGFQKTLLLEGVGFRVAKEGEGLTMNLGFSHPVKYPARSGISFEVEKNGTLVVKGIDKALVGQVAAEIRALKKPEPYKGKGFRYANEIIRRKAGKKAAASGGGAR